MWRRLSPLVFAVIAGGAVAATSALGGSSHTSQYKLPEPAITASSTLRLPALHRCVKGNSVRIGLVPPSAVTFASLSVRVNGDEVLTLASLGGPGSAKIIIPFGKVRLIVTGTTSGGQFVRAAQSYRRCRKGETIKKPTVTKPRPKPTPEPQSLQGGGVD